MKNVCREITPLAPDDSFLVFDRVQKKFDFPIHFHPEYELNFILNGKGARRIVGDSIEVIDDLELVLIGSNLSHGWESYQCTNDEVYEITIQFHENLFDDKLLSRRIFKSIKDLLQRSNYGVIFSKKTIKNLQPRLTNLAKISGMDYFMELLSILQDLATSRNQKQLSTYSEHNKTFEKSSQITKVYDYIHENFGRKITLAEISELANMTPVTFNRFIKRRMGKTFVEFTNETRISYAARWLNETDMSISEISYKCGFNNIANFNRIFKKIRNCTPSDYRLRFEGIKKVL